MTLRAREHEILGAPAVEGDDANGVECAQRQAIAGDGAASSAVDRASTA
jgi:hypothetical protein